MFNEKLIAQIVADVIEKMILSGQLRIDSFPSDSEPREDDGYVFLPDRSVPTVDEVTDPEALMRMKANTTARIGVGKAGARLKTSTLLTLRADHALARDAAFLDVGTKLLDELGLFVVQTKCSDKNEFLTRPDLGRQFDDEVLNTIRQRCITNPDIQIYASDGLSSKAIEANLRNILPVLIEGFREKGITTGTPFFVRFGRVPAMDKISEVLGAKVTCVLIGERPGLGSAESMSAYICYNARVGMPEARRTVVSNIHKNGIAAVEAGAYLVELICRILNSKASGIDLQR